MPPRQQQSGAAAAALSPKDAYFQRLDAAITSHNCKGSLIVQGIPRAAAEDDEEEEEDEEEDEDATRVYTAEEVALLRHILINDARDAALSEANRFVSGGQDEDGFMMFNTDSGNTIIFGIPKQVQKALRKPTLPARFDALLGLTVVLRGCDHWMHDNECYESGGKCETAVACLAAAWKSLLRNDDAALGIDAEFTRRGVESLLLQFAEQLADIERCDELGDEDGYEFAWR